MTLGRVLGGTILVLSGLGAAESPFADVTVPCGNGVRPWRDAPVTDYGPRTVTFETTGLRTLTPIPPPGQHPRIYVTEADLPDLRRRLRTTVVGQRLWNYLLAWTETLKGRYDPKAPYCTPDYWNGWSGWVHGPVPLMPLGDRGNGENWQKLVAGDRSANADGTRWNVLALEAFRCWVADDAAAAQDLAAATMTALAIGQATRAAELAKDPQRPLPDTPVGGTQLAHVYDFLFRWLTPEQRSAFHDELASTSARGAPYGTFEAASAARSTWATFCHHVLPLLAIEGEPGFNDLKLAACHRAWRNYLTYSINRSGCIFEGEGKLVLGAAAIMAFSRRPAFDFLGAHPHLRRYGDFFLPHARVADRRGFFAFDLLGGANHRPNAVDVILLRYLYPQDRRIAWVYRETLGEDYRHLPQDPAPWGEMNSLLFAAAFATDYDIQAEDPATLGLGTTFFDGQRALLMTRSDWSREALQLTMQTRQVSGGHPYADRNSIQVVGAGRAWSTVDGSEMFENAAQSVVVIDGRNQDVATPRRMVCLTYLTHATLAVGVGKYAWDWTWEGGIADHGWNFTAEEAAAGAIERHCRPGYAPDPHCPADFHLTFRDDPVERLPLARRPTWLGPQGWINPILRASLYPVIKAFRTAGLVRGPRPYALVIDDIRKDDGVHHYDWLLQLEPDLQATVTPLPPSQGVADVLLHGDPQAGALRESRLLVRILARTQAAHVPLPRGLAFMEDLKAGTWKRDRRRLVVPSDSIEPGYRILLYPHHVGDSLPTTTWNSDGTTVKVAWPDQCDEVHLTPGPSGKTNLAIVRQAPNPGELIRLDQPVPPLTTLGKP